jgi:hypothetical protein
MVSCPLMAAFTLKVSLLHILEATAGCMELFSL